MIGSVAAKALQPRSITGSISFEVSNMLIRETYSVTSSTSFDIEIAAAPSDGKKYPIVLLIHGNLGLAQPFGQELRTFTEQIAALGFLAALPSYYPRGTSDQTDTDIAGHAASLVGAVNHLSSRKDADPARLGLVGFSLGGGIAASHIQSFSRSVKVFADFYGFVAPLLSAGVTGFPPTIIFQNAADPVVRASENSKP